MSWVCLILDFVSIVLDSNRFVAAQNFDYDLDNPNSKYNSFIPPVKRQAIDSEDSRLADATLPKVENIGTRSGWQCIGVAAFVVPAMFAFF